MNRLFLILFLIAFGISGCSDSSSTGGWYPGNVIVPLEVGNRWIYRHELFLEDGRIDTTSFYE